MAEYEFELIFALPDGEVDMDTVLDRAFESGLDDGVIGLGAPGMIGLSVTRTGNDAETVIRETADAMRSALPKGAVLREVRPDLVSLADVAARLKVSRQALQKRPMPRPSLGGLYRAAEMAPFLRDSPGKIRDALPEAASWFAAAEGAQAVNAKLSLPDERHSPTDPGF